MEKGRASNTASLINRRRHFHTASWTRGNAQGGLNRRIRVPSTERTRIRPHPLRRRISQVLCRVAELPPCQ
jgi:hypothetical protein